MSERSRAGSAERAGWVAVGAMTVAAVSPLMRVPWRGLTMLQSLLPWSLAPAPILAAVAAARRRRGLAGSGLALSATGVAMTVPLVTRRRPTAPAPGGTTMRIAHANLLYPNRQIAEVEALLALPDLDVVTFSEYTPAHAAALSRSELADRFPHRVEKPQPLASGTALWSRHPVTEQPGPEIDLAHQIVAADVHGPELVRVIVIHTRSPVAHHDGWRDDLARLTTVPDDRPPTVMIGDFNAAWWHPEFRDLLADGWRDAHHDVGRGLTVSWPIGRWTVPFVRLDHALVDDGLIVTGVVDVEVAGSDHRGLVVSVVPAR